MKQKNTIQVMRANIKKQLPIPISHFSCRHVQTGRIRKKRKKKVLASL